MFNSSDTENPGNTWSKRTASALKSDANVASTLSLDWKTDFISPILYEITPGCASVPFLIDTFSVVSFSLKIICSPSINAPVVCDKFNSFVPEVFAFSARYPIAPLARPLTLVPFIFPPGFVRAVTLNVVYVCISKRYKSQLVSSAEYEASVKLNE